MGQICVSYYCAKCEIECEIQRSQKLVDCIISYFQSVKISEEEKDRMRKG